MSTIVRAVRLAVAPITRTFLFRRTAPTWMPPVEHAVQFLSRGRLQLSAILVPSLILHSRGAKSGLERNTELMYTPDKRGNAIIAGTSFAREHHPAWTYNLLENPDAAITVRGRRRFVRASLISDEDREAAWQLIESQWPGYRAYERDSGRVVRLFLLEPVSSPVAD